MRGTGYAVSEIVWWMLASGLLGLAIGWLLLCWRAHRFLTRNSPRDRLRRERRPTAPIGDSRAREEIVSPSRPVSQRFFRPDIYYGINGLVVVIACCHE